jgi:hypothetical protein
MWGVVGFTCSFERHVSTACFSANRKFLLDRRLKRPVAAVSSSISGGGDASSGFAASSSMPPPATRLVGAQACVQHRGRIRRLV